MYRDTRLHTATHGNTRQHTATHMPHTCNALQHTATHCNTQHCNTLQRRAAHCNTRQHTATHCNTLQHTATHCNTLQHTATQGIFLDDARVRETNFQSGITLSHVRHLIDHGYTVIDQFTTQETVEHIASLTRLFFVFLVEGGGGRVSWLIYTSVT